MRSSFHMLDLQYQRTRDKMTFEGSAVDDEVDWRAALLIATQDDNKDLLAFKVVRNAEDDMVDEDEDMFEDDDMDEDDGMD